MGPKTSETRSHLLFSINELHLGADLSQVREIVPVPPIVRLPKASAEVRGIANLHGEIVGVIDLTRKLGLPASKTDSAGSGARLIVAEISQGLRGLLADRVFRVVQSKENNIQTISDDSPVDRRFCLGKINVDRQFFFILDLNRLLSI